MFDIGFAELVLIGVVGLLVIGPERLPGAIRTGSQWLSHFKRGFNTMKREIEHELEIDSVKTQLTKANDQFKNHTEDFKRSLEDGNDSNIPAAESDMPDKPPAEPPTNQRPQGAAE
jgi:sec-independent protein translocase protein TatB